MQTLELERSEQRLITRFNELYSNPLEPVVHLRETFIRIRFNYLKRLCRQRYNDHSYTTERLEAMLADKGSGLAIGTEIDPFDGFEGRHPELKEEDYVRRLFRNPQGLTPDQLYVQEFNAFLREQRVRRELVADGSRKFWRPVTL